MSSTKIRLSATKIKVFQDCSWLYHCRYILKAPDEPNEGMHRGKITHSILECLLNPRHKKHFLSIVTKKHVSGSPAAFRLLIKLAKKKSIYTQENINTINEMILTGLNLDFYCEKAILVIPEEEFNYETETYSITGFIDKLAIYPDKSITVFDYKTNKSKFNKDEMDGNLQALMYSLICLKLRRIIPLVKFLFLKFPKDPELIAKKCSVEELQGFENYLAYITNYLNDFGIGKATIKYAGEDVNTKWLCGFAKFKGQLTKNGNLFYSCAYKFPFEYYVLVDKISGEILKSSKTFSDLKETENTQILFKTYLGCPFHGNKITRKKETIPDF